MYGFEIIGSKVCGRKDWFLLYGVDHGFWLKLMVLITILGVLIFSFNAIMRRLLKVEKKKFFSNNHINETHKKVDRSIRVTVIVLLIIGYLYNVTRPSTEWVWYLEPWFLNVSNGRYY